MKIERSFLYKATNDFLARSEKLERRICIEKGEIVEFRYFHPVNFRTIEGLFLRCEEAYFLENTEFYGKIWEQVYFRNQNSLRQILECKLYTKKL